MFETSFCRWKQRHTEKNEKLWGKIRDLIRSSSSDLGNYGNKNLKIKFNSDDNFNFKERTRTF